MLHRNGRCVTTSHPRLLYIQVWHACVSSERRPSIRTFSGGSVRRPLSIVFVLVLGCTAEPIDGPDPLRPQQYVIEMVNGNTAPAVVWGGRTLDSAFLIPYAVGRPVDQRLVNDRTGRGGTGGDTRDTTVARGQFIDLRVITGIRDSSIVDVVVKDTVVIITRPHPDPSRVRVDTGAFVGNQLLLATIIDYRQGYSFSSGIERCPEPMPIVYTPHACAYHAILTYKLVR